MKFRLILHYNGNSIIYESNVVYLIMPKEIYQFKAKGSEIKTYPLCLGNISGDFSANKMEKTGLNGCVYDFSVGYRAFDTRNIIDIHKYLMRKHNVK